jgi:hypothetical protein
MCSSSKTVTRREAISKSPQPASAGDDRATAASGSSRPPRPASVGSRVEVAGSKLLNYLSGGTDADAFVLVCSLATPDLSICNRDNALDVMRVPEEFASAVMCVMDGEVYLGQTAIGLNRDNREAIKVISVPSATVDAAQVRSARAE